jgi:hypothetical protein
MNALLGVLLPFARDAIAEHGTFFPIGASMAPDGELEAAGGDIEAAGAGAAGTDAAATGEPTAEGLLGSIRDRFRSRAVRGELLATGVASDVAIPEGTFPLGIRIELEHRDGDPITCVVPYRETGDGAYEYGEVVAFPGDRRTWA